MTKSAKNLEVSSVERRTDRRAPVVVEAVPTALSNFSEKSMSVMDAGMEMRVYVTYARIYFDCGHTRLCGRLFSLLSKGQRSCVVFFEGKYGVKKGFSKPKALTPFHMKWTPLVFLVHQVKLFFCKPLDIKSPGFISGPRFQGSRVKDLHYPFFCPVHFPCENALFIRIWAQSNLRYSDWSKTGFLILKLIWAIPRKFKAILQSIVMECHCNQAP